MTGIQLSRHTGDVLRTSTPIQESPHSLFLEEYLQIGERIFDQAAFRTTAYYKNASSCIRLFGRYFNATNDSEIEPLARNLVNLYENKAIQRGSASKAFSLPGEPISVYPILYSECYQLVDGNHRAAVACARGNTTVKVRIIDRPQLTTLQQYLLDVSWNVNRRELYQPILSPETKQWPLVRGCVDRFEMMEKHLRTCRLGNTRTYLDVACNHGWFVNQMRQLGFVSYGVEVDKFAREVGIAKYELDRDSLIASEARRFLESTTDEYDVVSCLSLLHHFVINDDVPGATRLLRKLDSITRSVLFLELGDCNEEWFSAKMRGWTPEHILCWIRENTSFSETRPLGTDRDRKPPFGNNYGRTLFACTR